MAVIVVAMPPVPMPPVAMMIPMMAMVIMSLGRDRNEGGTQTNRADDESLEYVHLDCEVSLVIWTGLNAALFNLLNRIKCTLRVSPGGGQ